MVSPITKILKPFKEVPVFEANAVLTEAYHIAEDRDSARLMLSARIKLLSDAADTMDLSVPDEKSQPVKRKKKASPKKAEPVVDAPQPEEGQQSKPKSASLDLNEAATLLSAASTDETEDKPTEAVAEQEPAEAPTGRAADPAFIEIFDEMVVDTKAGLTKIMDTFADNPAEGRSKAIAQAKNLSYAAEQMEFVAWQKTLDAFVANFPDDDTAGATAVAGLVLEIDKLSGNAPSEAADASPQEDSAAPDEPVQPEPQEQPEPPASSGKNPDFSELAELAAASTSDKDEEATTDKTQDSATESVEAPASKEGKNKPDFSDMSSLAELSSSSDNNEDQPESSEP